MLCLFFGGDCWDEKQEEKKKDKKKEKIPEKEKETKIRERKCNKC